MKKYKRTTLAATFKYLSVASMITAAASGRTQSLDQRSSTEAIGERFQDFLVRVNGTASATTKKRIVQEYVSKVTTYGRAVVEDSVVYFLFQGKAKRVAVPSDLNGWDPAADSMRKMPGTDLFYLATTVDRDARFEYKLVVDSTWILDPFNKQQAFGGYGPNSEVWMPGYVPPKEIEFRKNILHGSIDTLSVKSMLLGRTHFVFVYRPPGYETSRQQLPSIYVTDGGEYLSLALMNNVLDNLIAEKRIRPVIGIFVDPRTDIRDAQTSMRMHDYALSDTFVNFLITELRPLLSKRYRLLEDATNTAIMGASLGGLIATYAAATRPDVFGLCAAQSPSYWWKDEAVIKLLADSRKMPIKFYIDTGTIRDAQEHARKMKKVLEEKGYDFSYGEYPESHNWVNWRSRLGDILVYFWGKK
jgi:enterochelin esterase-like enzyme